MLGPPSKAEIQDCEAIIVIGLPGMEIQAIGPVAVGVIRVVISYHFHKRSCSFVFALEESPCHVLWLAICTTPAACLLLVHYKVQNCMKWECFQVLASRHGARTMQRSSPANASCSSAQHRL